MAERGKKLLGFEKMENGGSTIVDIYEQEEGKPWFEIDTPEVLENLAIKLADEMAKVRRGKTMMPWKISPERKEALCYAITAIGYINDIAMDEHDKSSD